MEEGVVVGEGTTKAAWGTWEELLLGGAVLRHGADDWDAVSSELRARTACPFSFTAEVCKAKYEDLQQRYSGCRAWFEELRKQRMAELKLALEKSEDSIGSLESKLESLKAEKGIACDLDNDSSQTESPIPFQKSMEVESSRKETSKDGLSAGSFTQDTRTNWSPKCQIPAAVSSEDMEAKPEISESSKQEKISSSEKLGETSSGRGGRVRGRRGKRKRKDCTRDVKEGSVGESDFLGSTDVASASQCKEISMGDHGQVVVSSGIDDCNKGCSSREEIDDLMGIFYSIMENENAPVFRGRHDSQRRARYKKLVRQHMDFDTIRSRINSHLITTSRELFRDLLLLANNALVFYSKKSREHKSAVLLRDLVSRRLKQHYKDSRAKAAVAVLSTSPIQNPPVKPRSIRPSKQKTANAGKVITGTPPPQSESKKSFPLQGKVKTTKRVTGPQPPQIASRGRKKARVR